MKKTVKKESIDTTVEFPKKPFYGAYMGKGFLFNIANPSVWVYWLIPVGIASAFPEREQSYLFMISLLLTILTFDVLKCAVSYKLKTVLTPKIIHIIKLIKSYIFQMVQKFFL